MTRADLLRDLLHHGNDSDPAGLAELVTELGLPVANVLVVAAQEAQRLSGRPDPGFFRPVSKGLFDCPDP
jgi:hypothetical protein